MTRDVDRERRGCDMPGCDRPMAVGVGSPTRWVCFPHYEDYLRDAAALMRRLREAVAPEAVPDRRTT